MREETCTLRHALGLDNMPVRHLFPYLFPLEGGGKRGRGLGGLFPGRVGKRAGRREEGLSDCGVLTTSTVCSPSRAGEVVGLTELFDRRVDRVPSRANLGGEVSLFVEGVDGGAHVASGAAYPSFGGGL